MCLVLFMNVSNINCLFLKTGLVHGCPFMPVRLNLCNYTFVFFFSIFLKHKGSGF